MSAEAYEQLRLLIENLHAVLHPIDYPNVIVAVDGNAFRPCEVAWPVARFAKGADEFAVAVEDLDAVVQRVSDIKIAFSVHRQSPRPGKIARCGERVLLSASAHPAFQL